MSNPEPTLMDCDYSEGRYRKRLLEWLLSEQANGRIPVPKVVVEVKQQ